MKLGKSILKISLWVMGAGFLIYMLLISFLLQAPKLNSYVNQIAFDSKQWRTHLTDQDTIKQKMVSDLFSKYIFVGMSKDSIDQLLGRPPKPNYFSDYDYVYWLGPERSAFGVDSEWLGIKFGKGFVIKAEILRD